MLLKIITGGQTGTDQAGLRAARAAGIPTGGWAPYGWLTEDGPAPWLAEWGLVECPARGYPARTRRNVLDSNATVWFGTRDSLGYITTHNEALDAGRPFLIVVDAMMASEVADGIEACAVPVLNVAGNRESVELGIGERVERFLVAVFRRLAAVKE